MHAAQSPGKALKGLSFDIDDLTLIRDRSEANGLHMVVRLDYGSDVEEYEEVLALHAGTNPQYRWLMWRNTNTVFVRSLDGRALRYGSATQAIDSLARKLRGKSTHPRTKHSKPDPIRTLADVIRETAASDADPYTLMGALVEAAVHTLATRIPVILQDDTAAVVSQLLTDRLKHYSSLR
jgi:hypothetical protein